MHISSNPDLPSFLRVNTFGPLSLESLEMPFEHGFPPRYVPLAPDKLQGRGTAQALSLLKVLLCQPNRHASRDFLMETLWPDKTRSEANARLDDISSTLRNLLRPASGENLLPAVHASRGTGNSYQLASYPLIWVDADAFEWSIEQAARMERFDDDALPFWEAAFRLASRGTFLADEPYSD